jgi:hypothetical protein
VRAESAEEGDGGEAGIMRWCMSPGFDAYMKE